MPATLPPTVSAPGDAEPFGRSARVYLWLMAYLVAARVAIAVHPAAFRSTQQAAAFDWPFLALWTVLGLGGTWLAARTGFAGAWDARIPLRRRVWFPLGAGLALGALAVGIDRWTHWTAFVAGRLGLPTIHIAFPASVLLYPGGAIISEVVFRLVPIPALLWLVSFAARRAGRPLSPAGLERAFWVIAVLISLAEPAGDLGLRPLGMLAVGSVFAQDYALNLGETWLFRRDGLVAATLLRVSFYLVWHVLYGLLTAPA